MNQMPKLKNLLKSADILLIVPPFASIDRTCLPVHILQACAKNAGFTVEILYANILFAAEIGEINYYFLCRTGLENDFLGERFFCRKAFSKVPFGNNGLSALQRQSERFRRIGINVEINEIQKQEAAIGTLIDDLSALILQKSYPIIGFTNSFDQTASSIALINSLKKHGNPLCIMGGSNCLGEMANGLSALSENIDFVFCGEAEISFVWFLKAWRKGNISKIPKIILQNKMTPIEEIPPVRYDEYFSQFNSLLPKSKIISECNLFLQFETSRGCWKGHKQPCFFCGLNGEVVRYRAKEPQNVINEIKMLVKHHPTRKIAMADCIIPPKYFVEFLAAISNELDLTLTYEVRSNITKKDLILLQNAGVRYVQPGIESLSTSHLRKMNKGVIASDNLRFLRIARGLMLSVSWYLLYDIPSETLNELEELKMLIPLIEHFDSPKGFVPLRLDRFSPYFEKKEAFGISNVTAWQVYKDVFPNNSNLENIAYHFNGEYQSASRENPDLVDRIHSSIEIWKKTADSRSDNRSRLDLHTVSKDKFLLVDTRSMTISKVPRIINKKIAKLLALELSQFEINCYSKDELKWAKESGYIISIDQILFPLVTADEETVSNLLLP